MALNEPMQSWPADCEWFTGTITPTTSWGGAETSQSLLLMLTEAQLPWMSLNQWSHLRITTTTTTTTTSTYPVLASTAIANPDTDVCSTDSPIIFGEHLAIVGALATVIIRL